MHPAPGHLEDVRDRVLTVAQVAAYLQVSRATVYKLCDSGALQHVRASNGIRIAPADLAAYLGHNKRGDA